MEQDLRQIDQALKAYAIKSSHESLDIQKSTVTSEEKFTPFLLGLSEKPTFEGNTKPADLSTFKEAVRYEKTDPHFKFKRNQYKLVRTLGSGTFATVIEAKWLPTGEHVAVKMIDKEKMVHYEESLKTEIDILCKIHHPNLLKLFDWGFGKNTIYIVTELARGGELFDRIIERGCFYETDACTVIRSILEAVAYLHRLNIVHRDLKPENIFLRDPKHQDFADVIIGDFGISKMMNGTNESLKTKTGSFGYVAPEILMSQTYGKPCDIWSIGIIAYVLVTGTSPYNGEGFDEELDDILEHPIKFKEKYWQGVSDEAKDFTAKCLKVSPHLRPTADEALQHQWFEKFPKPVIKVESKSTEQKNQNRIVISQFTNLLPIPRGYETSSAKSQEKLNTHLDLLSKVKETLGKYQSWKKTNKLKRSEEGEDLFNKEQEKEK